MSFTFCTETRAADWLLRSTTPREQLLCFGPAGFEAFARLRYIPDPAEPGQHEADAAVAGGHASDLERTRQALHLLAAFTSTPQECYFSLWDGYSDARLPPQAQHGPLVELPHRRYALFRGALDDIDHWATAFGNDASIAPPAFIWPSDHRWCFASDVDPHWAGIGAEQAAVDALIAHPTLDVVPARPEQDHPRYR
ncbi:MAG: hypothetical protein ACRCSN_01905 [Dermatophilaceae bacterium]